MKTYPMAFIPEAGKIDFYECDIRDPKPDEVMIEVRAAAICGSEH